jgi:hypothetical protein
MASRWPRRSISRARATRSRCTATIAKRIPLRKTGDERYVLGIVLEPETVDAQSDIYSAAEVRDAAHRFMQQYRNVGLMHQGLVNSQVKILESYVAPVSFQVDRAEVRKATWLLAVRIVADELWLQVKTGEIGASRSVGPRPGIPRWTSRRAGMVRTVGAATARVAAGAASFAEAVRCFQIDGARRQNTEAIEWTRRPPC